MKPVTQYSTCLASASSFHVRSSFGDYCLFCDLKMQPEKSTAFVRPEELDDALNQALRVRPTEQDRPRVRVLRLDPDIDAHRDDEEP